MGLGLALNLLLYLLLKYMQFLKVYEKAKNMD